MKKVLILIFTLMFLISMITVVNAASANVSAVASSNQVTKGNTFTVSLVGTSDTPIDGMYTKFSYDTSVLELVSKAPASNYGDNSSVGEILVQNNSSSTSQTTGQLYTLTFKVLDNAKEGNTTINFSESEMHLNTNGTIDKATVTINAITVTIKADTTTVDQDNNKENTQDTNKDSATEKENTPSNNKNTTSTNSTKSTTTSSSSKKTKLPQTGAEVGSVIAIAILSVIAVISYVSYKKYKNI